MASRGTYGSRATRKPAEEIEREGASSGLPRRSSITSTTASTSKIPSSSWFSRGKQSRVPAALPSYTSETSSNKGSGLSQRAIESMSTRSEPAAKAIPQPSRTLGLGIWAAKPTTSRPAIHQEKRQPRVLRRKASSIDQHSRYAHTTSSVSSEPAPTRPQRETASTPGRYVDSSAGSVLGIAIPTVSSPLSYLPGPRTMNYNQATSSSIMANYSRRQQSATASTQNLPQPTPSFAHSSGSSTRRSESPGSFSRTSTPTSMSSYSPGISVPAKTPMYTRQLSPTRSRPPVTRRHGVTPHRQDLNVPETRGLPALRESATSSSSSSTVKGAERSEGTKIGNPGNRLVSPPAGVPFRASSNQVMQPRNESKTSETHGHPSNISTNRLVEAMSETEPREVTRPRRSTASPILRMGPALTRTVPTRPSRENTPKLEDLAGPPQVIQSNINRLIITGHKRRDSIDRSFQLEVGAEAPFTVRPTLGRSPSSSSSVKGKPSRLPSPSTGVVGPSRLRKLETSHAKEIPPVEGSVRTGKSNHEPSPLSAGSSKSSNRFGLFTKRTKSPLEITSAESAERAAKKGPAAGTGHEGYGKYARRGRSGSTSTSASRGRSTSTGHSGSVARTSTSRKSSFTSRDEPVMDDFLRERMTPVVISGGGLTYGDHNSEVDLYRTSSGESSAGMRSTHSPVRETTFATESYDYRFFRRNVRMPDTPDFFAHITSQGADEAEAEAPRGTPTLAARRSLHRSQLFKEAEPLKIPTPINTRVLAPAPIIDSRDTAQSSVLQTDDSSILLTDSISEGREGNWLNSRKSEKRVKSPRKWNFFQRAHATPKTPVAPSSYDDQEDIRELPVTISRLPELRPVAHYAMLDGSDQADFDETDGQPQESENIQQGSNFGSALTTADEEAVLRKQDHKVSMLLPSPPNFPAEFAHLRRELSPSVHLRQPEPPASTSIVPPMLPKPREPRLQQVGRIPRVISKRDRLHRPPPQSFSRPFMRTPVIDNELSNLENQREDLKNAERPILGVQTEMLPSHAWGEPDSSKPASAPVVPRNMRSPPGRAEFLSFLPRIDSEVSGSSSSGVLSLATTAVVPPPGTALSEDEVWNEYDDFLDNVDSRASQAKYHIEQHPKPRKSQWTPEPLHIRKESLVAGSTNSPPKINVPMSPGAPPSHGLPSPPGKSAPPSFPSADTASTPVSISDFFAGYGDRNRSSGGTRRQSESSGSRYSTDSIQSRHRDTTKRRNTDIIAEKSGNDPGPQSNLRFSALMTSRWLSFGRVLFSPAHMEIQSNRQDRVLVLDGLGNDDWSFYCALTYPNATVYNLSSFRRTSTSSERKREADGYGSPSNHRQIYHTSMKHPFPFPKGFFTAAVFRFPVASSEDAYFNAISECKRVLRPGGFLEMSILDLDMVNMGNRARRAVRMLKVRMQTAEPEVSLKPVSDNVQKMLGRRGFENLSRCTFSVPVSGNVSSSRAGSFDEDMSLGDMLKDPSQQGDESITKMVSKVGRWWYTRCYEMSMIPDDDVESSIWTDKALLRECEKRETGFKLLICYAQKPLAPRRRTVSM